MPVKVALLGFERGYHVSWRKPREVIDHSTVLRALVYLAHLTGSERCAELIESGGLAASALLPALPVGEGYVRPLAAFPYIPCLGKASRFRGLYTTLPALRNLMEFVRECHGAGGVPVATGADEELGVSLSCIGRSRSIKGPPLGLREGVVCLESGDCADVSVYATTRFTEVVLEHRNRLDRISGAADVFVLYGARTRTPLWLALHGDEDSLACAERLLEVLQHTGIGGLRSRGWGRFRALNELKLKDEDQRVLNLQIGWAPGLVYLLGTMPPGAWLKPELSYASRYVIMGRSGPPNDEYVLPVLEVMDVGSLVHVKSVPKPEVISINGGRALYIFNPVVLRAA